MDARKQAEAALALIEGCPDAVVIADASGRVLAANRRAATAFGGRLAGTMLADLVAVPHLPLLKGGEVVRLPLDALRCDGSTFPAELTLSDHPVGRVAFFHDVSERRAVEAALRVSEARLTAFFDHVPAGLYLKDHEGRYLLVNADVLRRLRRPLDAVIGRSAWDLWDAGVARRSGEQDAQVLATGRPLTAEETYVQPHATTYMSGTRFVVPDDHGAPNWIGGILMDVTERKLAEEEARRSREALLQSEKLNALGSLLAGVSHELNNPLAAVLGQAIILEEDAEGTPFGERAVRIRTAAERCARIVQVFLAMARQKPARRLPVDLNGVVAGALELVAYQLRTSGVAVTTDLASDLPPVFADSDQLHQVLLNLLVNAQQAMIEVEGERALRIVTRTAPGGHAVEMTLADSGPGIDATTAKRIFEPFFSTKPLGSGTGIGLSFSLGVAEAHGGSLRLVDGGPGATFLLTMPVAAADMRAPAATEGRSWPRRGATVLVVDDEEEVAAALQAILGHVGYEVETAVDVEAALEQVGARHFDFLVSDMRMPMLGGTGLHARVRAIDPRLADATGFMTGDLLNGQVVAALAETGRPVLEKPFTLDSVHALMAQLAARAQSSGG